MALTARSSRTTGNDLAVIGVLLLDDAHTAWVAAEADAEQALRAWFEDAAPNRTEAYLTYRAAVDREEAAARDLERLCELTQPFQRQLARIR